MYHSESVSGTYAITIVKMVYDPSLGKNAWFNITSERKALRSKAWSENTLVVLPMWWRKQI